MLENIGLYLLRVINAALHDTPCPPRPANITWEGVHALALRNDVSSTAFFGACTASDMPDDLRVRWEAETNSVLFRLASFDVERSRICAALDEAGIAHLALKGVPMLRHYPRPEMRMMADNDILYGFVEPDPAGGYRICGATAVEQARTIERAQTELVRIMGELGFTPRYIGAGNADCFEKRPIFNFEMHRRLFTPEQVGVEHYENPWQRARPVAGDGLAFEFSPEDEYVYHVAHTFKHFDTSGCGIRCVVDEWVMLRHVGARLDAAYIASELDALGLTSFERMLRDLAQAAFGPIPDLPFADGGVRELAGEDALRFSSEQLDVLRFMLGCGTYGTMESRVARSLDKLADSGSSGAAGKARYLLRRVFLPRAVWKSAYPRLSRFPGMYYVVPFVRLAHGLVKHPSRLLRELKTVLNR